MEYTVQTLNAFFSLITNIDLGVVELGSTIVHVTWFNDQSQFNDINKSMQSSIKPTARISYTIHTLQICRSMNLIHYGINELKRQLYAFIILSSTFTKYTRNVHENNTK